MAIVDRGKSEPSTWLRVLQYFGRHTGGAVASVLLVVFSVLLTSVSPLLLQRIIDEALPKHDVALLAQLCGAMIASAILAAVASVVQMIILNRVGQAILHMLRMEVYDRVIKMPLSFFASRPESEVQSRLVSDLDGINNMLTYTAYGILASLVNLVVCCIIMFFLSWPLALLSLFLAIALNWANNVFARRRVNLAGARQQSVAELMRLVKEDLTWSGVVLGRTFNRQGALRSRFVAESRRIADLTYEQRLLSGKAFALIMVAFACLPPLIYWAAGTVFGGISVGTVVVVATLQARLSGPLQNLLSLSGTVQTSKAEFARVFEYLDLPLPEELADDDSVVRGGVQLQAVGHSYIVDRPLAVDGVTLNLEPGQTTLIVGETGSGKSTLSLILSGLITPTVGSVAVAGSVVNARQLRRVVTLVPQQSMMFNASLRENLLFSRPTASDGELQKVLAVAGLEDLLSRLPRGLDTQLGEGGLQFSGGERQRIALARALLAPSDVLVLDEATSALDAETAERVHQALLSSALAPTLVIVAHRIPRMRPLDQVVVMRRGQILEAGTHRALAGSDTAYDRLLHLQQVGAMSDCLVASHSATSDGSTLFE